MLKRRYLFVIRSYAPDQVGGGAKSVRNLAEGLQRRGHDVHIARLVPRGHEARARAEAEAAGVTGPGKPTLHFLPIRNIYWPYDLAPRDKLRKALWHLIDLGNPAARRDFRRLLADVRPDVINTSIIDGFSTSIFRAAREAGIPLVHTMRDYYLVCTRSGMFRQGHNCRSLCTSCRLSAGIRRKHAQAVDLFLANSAYVADTNRRLGAFSPDAPALVQWNINERPADPQPRVLDPGRALRFGFIGRLSPTKGVEEMLKAFQARSADSGWELKIAGSGDASFERHLRDTYGGDARIRFLGWSKADDFYAGIDVLICPSTYNEPLPRVIYEAYGHGLPVIAANTGGIPEIVEDGTSGLLYDGDSIERMADCVDQFRAMSPDRYAAMSAEALRIAQWFAPETVLSVYEQRIEGLLGGEVPA